jgi:hypothetical protein
MGGYIILGLLPILDSLALVSFMNVRTIFICFVELFDRCVQLSYAEI